MEKSSRYIWQVAGLFATLIIAMAFLAVILFTVKRSVTISQSVMIWAQDVPLFAIFYFINRRFTKQQIGIKPTISWGPITSGKLAVVFRGCNISFGNRHRQELVLDVSNLSWLMCWDI